jgi:nitrite reductase/ring-hydroxylating ferredoxin subunit
MLVAVGSVANLPEDQPTTINVDGRPIVLIRSGEQVHALRDVCPHQTQSFADGVLHREFVAVRPGEMGLGSEPVIACPWHHWEFSVTTGRCVADPRFRVRVYDVVIEDGNVFVETSAKKGDR